MTTPKDTWISVKDAMPEEHAEVVVYSNDHFLARLKKYIDYYEFICDGSVIQNVTHWMLLSKPKTTN